MKTYECILFDADETLFRFDSFKGLKRMFLEYDFLFTEQHYQEYQTINKPLWIEYQNNIITAQELQHRRFSLWGERLHVSTAELSKKFLLAMAEICEPLEGAVSLLNVLKGHVKLGIITNGFTELQQARLNRTGLKQYFDCLVISEELGIAKPHPSIFNHAISLLGNPDRDHVLMVGDTLESDILGGINAGIDTCWLNRTQRSLGAEEVKPLYEIASLEELEILLTH